MVDLGMAFVDNWVVGKEKGCYWLSNDVVEMVGEFGHVGMIVAAWVSPSFSPSSFALSFVQAGWSNLPLFRPTSIILPAKTKIRKA